MKLTAINRVQGVKVLAGKGKGGKSAFAGDVFEPKTDAEGKRLIELGVAMEYKVHDPLAEAEAGKGGSKTTRKTGGRKATGNKAAQKDDGKAAQKDDGKAAQKDDGKAAQKDDGKAGGDTGGQKAEDGSDTADDEDLGLGE